MCIILIGNITWEQHKLAKAENRDGFSLYTRETGLIKCPTNKDVDKAINKFGIWHYRIGTSGTISANSKANIHPFPICKGNYYLYHNGILGSGYGSMSDTRAFAETLANVSIDCAKTIVNAVSTNQRLAIVSATTPTEFYLYGDWKVDAGVIMSHKLYSTSYYNSSLKAPAYLVPKNAWEGEV